MLGLAEKDTKNSYYSCIACAQKAKQKFEHTKKTQTKLLEMKTTISKMENILGEVDSRLDFLKDTEFKGTATKTIQNKTHREKGFPPK